MLKAKNKIHIYSVIFFIILIIILFSTVYSLPLDYQTQIDEKIDELSLEEKQTLKLLLKMSNEILILKTEEDKLKIEILSISNMITDINKQIDERTIIYNSKLETYKKFLQNYQRKGIVSYLDSVLKAENFKMFIRRINLLRELSQNTKLLFVALDNAKNELDESIKKLNSTLMDLKSKNNSLAANIKNTNVAIEALDESLLKLADEREYYEEQLEKIGNEWNNTVATLSDLSTFFKELFNTDVSLSADLIEISYGLFESKAVISEGIFNDIIKSNFKKETVVFKIVQDMTTISMIDSELSFTGEFIIIDDKTIEFVANSAEYKGLIMSKEDFASLFSDISFKLFLEDILGNATIKSLKNNNGNIEIVIKNNIL